MLPTPSTTHISFDRIYEPAEDSYLLLDTLSSADETAFLRSHFQSSPPPLVTEIGTGSGVVLAFLTAHASTIFGRSDIFSLGVDINSFACEATSQTVSLALERQEEPHEGGLYLGNVQGDLNTALRQNSIDVLVFNPPYVPTPTLPSTRDLRSFGEKTTFEEDSQLLELSYAGGEDGMETTNRLLDALPETLSQRGIAYILLCAQNKPEEVKSRVVEHGWQVETVGSSGKKAGWEKLVILRIWRG